jgi:hypothetical protein
MTSKINALSTGVGGIATTADASGILEIQTNDTTAITVDGSQVVSFDNNFGTVAGLPSYQCRAWVNFNGTGTVAIRASGNVSGITDNGTGDYTVNFATALSDANYSISAISVPISSGVDSRPVSVMIYGAYTTGATTKTTTAVRIYTAGIGATLQPLDTFEINLSFFR